MTVAAQKELKEKALASIPVKAGGGYQFIYTKDQGGIVYVYPDKYGEKYKEGTFTRSSLAVGNSSYRKYEIKLDGMERTYIVQRYFRRRHEVWLWCLMAFMRISWISLQMTIPKWKVYTPCRLSVRFSDLECMGEPA